MLLGVTYRRINERRSRERATILQLKRAYGWAARAVIRSERRRALAGRPLEYQARIISGVRGKRLKRWAA